MITRVFFAIVVVGLFSLAETLLAAVGVGIAISVTWALVVYGFNWCRNFSIERQIRKSLRPSGPGISIGRNVDVTIKHTTSVPVIVRSFCLKCGEKGKATVSFELNEDRSPKAMSRQPHWSTWAVSPSWIVCSALRRETVSDVHHRG